MAEEILNAILSPDYASTSDVAVNETKNVTRSAVILLNYSLVNTILVGLGLLAVIFVTAFGNFLVGLSLFRYRSLRTISNYLIGNLALSDFLLSITILPLSTVNECLGHWIFGQVCCKIMAYEAVTKHRFNFVFYIICYMSPCSS